MTSEEKWAVITVICENLWACHCSTFECVPIRDRGTDQRTCAGVDGGRVRVWLPMQRTGTTPDHCASGKILQCSLYFSWGFSAGPTCHQMLWLYLADIYQRRNIKRSSPLKKTQMLSANFSANFHCNDVCLMKLKCFLSKMRENLFIYNPSSLVLERSESISKMFIVLFVIGV